MQIHRHTRVHLTREEHSQLLHVNVTHSRVCREWDVKLHLGGTVAHRLVHNYSYKLYNAHMLSFVLTGLDHGEYTTYRLCVITW